MKNSEIVIRFLSRFAVNGFPPIHNHDSAKHKDAVVSQGANLLYLDCDMDMGKTETVLAFCVREGWVVAPFGLALGLGINQETFEATAEGLDKGKEILNIIEGPDED